MYGKSGYCWEEAGSAAINVQCPKITSGEYSSCSECRRVFRSVVKDEATGEIKVRIDGIQNSTGLTVDGIRKISDIILEIDNFVGNITTAVEEQGAVMSELISNISEAGKGIDEVARNVAQSSQVSGEIAVDIARVNQSTVEISSGTGKVLENAEELKVLSEELQNLIEKFKG